MTSINNSTISLDKILKNAFFYWKKTLIYQLVYGLLSISIFLSIMIHFADQFGLWEQYIALVTSTTNSTDALIAEMNKIAQSEEFIKLQYIQLATLVLLFPLQVGFYKIFRKIDLNLKFTMQDFLSGYTGINFFIYSSFYLFWYIIFGYAMSTVILGIVWIFFTIFSVPLMFFENRRIFETIKINYQLLKKNFIIILVGILVSFLFKSIVSLTLIGIPLVMAFGNAMVYSMYQSLYTEKEIK